MTKEQAEKISRKIVEKYFADPFDEDGSQRNDLEELITSALLSATQERDEKLKVAIEVLTQRLEDYLLELASEVLADNVVKAEYARGCVSGLRQALSTLI